MPIRFRVEDVFRMRHEAISMVMVGHLLEGKLTYPITLVDEATRAEVTIKGFEQVVIERDPEMLSLMIDKASPTLPSPGMVLVDPS